MAGIPALSIGRARRQKYGNVRCEYDGFIFDSKAEMRHYCELVLREKAGEIEQLVVHPRYPLMVNDRTIAHYVADFTYRDKRTDQLHTIDVKGGPTNTPLSKLKQRMFKAQYGRAVEIVS